MTSMLQSLPCRKLLEIPVSANGSMSASHLNGELGEVRYMKHDETGIRLGVNFEKKGVKSALVKPSNLLRVG